MEAAVAKPVRTLREHAKSLEAAMEVNLVKPKKKAVHELRAETRRIEAQLDLLQMVRGLPSYRAEAEKLLDRLSKLRRLAGDVRDCDVQRKILEDKERVLASATEDAKALRKDQDRLLKFVIKRRKHGEARLVRSLKQQQTKLTRQVELVLDVLKPAEDTEAAASGLLTNIEQRFVHLLRVPATGQEHLHEVRKAAKRGRYQCEAIPGARAAVLAKRLEDLQDAGGEWHDFLMLAEESAEELGADHPLTRVLERKRDEHLDDYLKKLEDFRSAGSSAERKSSHAPRQKRTQRRPAKSSSDSRASRRAVRR
jgi:CHAD domain-containing protein